MLVRRIESPRKQVSMTLPFSSVKGLFDRLSNFSGMLKGEATSFVSLKNAAFHSRKS